jgi:RecA-family ATPase
MAATPIEGRVKPCDTKAEQAILSAVLCAFDRVEQAKLMAELVPLLPPAHFYGPQHQIIWTGMLAIHAERRPIDIVTLRATLSASGKLERAGGVKYLAQLFDEVPATAYPLEYARIVVEHARVRRTISVLEMQAAMGYSLADGEAQEYLSRVDASVREAVQDQDDSGFRLLSGAAILDRLDPIKWVCPDLCLGPGRPTLVAGYGYSLKTFALQAMAVAVATGRPVWGEFRCVQGKVLHIDYEQGEYATRMRYQRLAFGLGIAPDELAQTLSLACFPGVYLTTAGIEDTLARICEGYSLCIIDSFRAASPGVDENDSGVRIYLDILTRVSERTGCSFVVIHHAGKDQPDRDSRQVARGSSAIFDACGTVLKLQGKKAFEPVKVDLVKTSAAAVGKVQQVAFYLEAVDVTDEDGNTKAGVRIEHRTVEQIDQPEGMAPSDSWARDLSEVQAGLRKNPGTSANNLARVLGKRKNIILDALQELESRGLAARSKATGRSGGGGNSWRLVSTSSESEEA